jgi:hypothetical protein
MRRNPFVNIGKCPIASILVKKYTMSPQAGLQPATRRLTAESNKRSEMEKKTALKDFPSSSSARFSNRWI